MGVLGAANIARKVVIPSILRADGIRLVAIGSESQLGTEFASTLQGRVRACSYDELLADPEVEAESAYKIAMEYAVRELGLRKPRRKRAAS